MDELYNHMDISTKYGFIKLSEIIHHYFQLDGEYVYPIETEVITLNKRNLRMDIAYLRNDNVINNIENQGYIVDMKKLEIIAEYAKFLLINNDSLIDSIIISKVNPKYCEKEIYLTKTLILRPYYLYKSPEEILERLNNITSKVNNNIKLTYDEACEWAMLPTLAQDDIAPFVTQKVCEQLKNDKTIRENLKTDICFILQIMIDRNIKNEKTKKELLEMINMEKRKTALEYLIEIETQKLKEHNYELKEDNDELKESNVELKESNVELKEDNKKLLKRNEELTEMLSEVKEYVPKELLYTLLKL